MMVGFDPQEVAVGIQGEDTSAGFLLLEEIIKRIEELMILRERKGERSDYWG